MTFKTPTVPESMGRCADLYKEVQTLRLAMAKEVETVEAFEKTLKRHMIDNLEKSSDTGASGLRYRVQIVTKTIPRIRIDEDADTGQSTAEGWRAFWDYVRETNRFDLMQKRLADRAIKDMFDAGEDVPGVELFKQPDVSITKI